MCLLGSYDGVHSAKSFSTTILYDVDSVLKTIIQWAHVISLAPGSYGSNLKRVIS